ncbi:hypothetical protein A0128_10740 [Leptospira tipperaryensis]|uniref:Uncharacterized protein n=1 Tax=Leptospira tipperaryensis TaxID=2564040 RepID=A0A1D7UXH2_9LEPT|nr:hypothetical protein [Leptospira tipperaryensis]AOP34282.1 hypothetical protein A0128_10740 [Leptospira tipperaryensis]
MMLFIAIALILVGLLCFIYVSLNPHGSGQDRPTSKSSSARSGNSEIDHLISRPNSKRAGEILASNKRASQTENVEKQRHLENLFVEGRKIPKQSPISYSSSESQLENLPSDEEEFISQETSPSGIQVLEESPKYSFIKENKEEEVREIRFEIDGILYLDQNRELPFEKLADKKEDLTPDLLRGLKRIGPGKLNESKESLSFEALNSSYRYSFSEIEKILFFDEGIVLIPSKSNYPIPVFFTKETSHLKSYLESSSKTFPS